MVLHSKKSTFRHTIKYTDAPQRLPKVDPKEVNAAALCLTNPDDPTETSGKKLRREEEHTSPSQETLVKAPRVEGDEDGSKKRCREEELQNGGMPGRADKRQAR